MSFFKYFSSCLLLIFILFSHSCSQFQTNKSLLSVTSNDKYWTELVEQSLSQKTQLLLVLEEKNKPLYFQIKNDAKDSIDSSLLDLWGQSKNIDASVKKTIIDHTIISGLQAEFKIKNDNEIVHAGIAHTYGYLFSTLSTPYGFKRKRWIDSSLNTAFSFTKKSLSPETEEGGLLSNITYFAGMLVLKNEQTKAKINSLKNVSKEVLQFNYQGIKPVIVEENVIENGQKVFSVRTTLISFPLKNKEMENDYLLIYSIHLNSGKELLITAFPITKGAFKGIISPDTLGKDKEIQLRYNAYLQGFESKKLTGEKRIKD